MYLTRAENVLRDFCRRQLKSAMRMATTSSTIVTVIKSSTRRTPTSVECNSTAQLTRNKSMYLFSGESLINRRSTRLFARRPTCFLSCLILTRLLNGDIGEQKCGRGVGANFTCLNASMALCSIDPDIMSACWISLPGWWPLDQ